MTIKQIGMGVSQWKEHGKTHGYWDYFVEAERTRLKKEVLERLPPKFWEDGDHAVGGYISKKDLYVLFKYEWKNL